MKRKRCLQWALIVLNCQCRYGGEGYCGENKQIIIIIGRGSKLPFLHQKLFILLPGFNFTSFPGPHPHIQPIWCFPGFQHCPDEEPTDKNTLSWFSTIKYVGHRQVLKSQPSIFVWVVHRTCQQQRHRRQHLFRVGPEVLCRENGHGGGDGCIKTKLIVPYMLCNKTVPESCRSVAKPPL